MAFLYLASSALSLPDSVCVIQGVVTLNDGMMVYFCLKSPMASKMQLCRNRDAETMHRHLHVYKDSEFRNSELISCVNDEKACPAAMKTHLDNLLLEPVMCMFVCCTCICVDVSHLVSPARQETVLPIQYILVYMCRNAAYKAELAVCAEDAGYLTWRSAYFWC